MTLGEFRKQTKELSDDLILEFYSERYNDSTQPIRLEFDTEGYVEFVINDDRWSLKQEPKTGHWIMEDMFDGDVAYRCSECNELFWIESGTPKDNEYNFCPKCGKRLVEPQESEDKTE